MPPIDTIHWENIRDRSPNSLAELYDGFAGAMFSLALEVLGDRWEAEEVIQDVFAYVWKKPESFTLVTHCWISQSSSRTMLS